LIFCLFAATQTIQLLFSSVDKQNTMKNTLLILLLCIGQILFGQSLQKIKVGGSIHGNYAMSINGSSSNQALNIYTPNTFSQYADSVNKMETGRLTFGISAMGTYAFNKNWELMAGLSYINIGFQRQQRNIGFGDRLHPGIGNGKVTEFSNTEKEVDYHYRYQYIQIPILFNYQLYKSTDFTKNVKLSMGLSPAILINHDIKANLRQFVVDNEERFVIDSTGYEGSILGLTLNGGLYVDYKIDKLKVLYVQPMLSFSPFSVSSSPISANPLFIQLHVGLLFSFDENKR
jgi:hypothetical protein